MQLILLSQLLLGRNSAGVCLKCRFGRNPIKLRQRQQHTTTHLPDGIPGWK
jgi:hypothetical protein